MSHYLTIGRPPTLNSQPIACNSLYNNPIRPSIIPSVIYIQLNCDYIVIRMSTFPDKVQVYISQIDKELSKYPALNNLEKQTSVPKVYAFLGLIATYFAFIFFNLGGQLLTNVAGFVIPGYYSLEALFSVGKADDTQWLTYWVVFTSLTVLESAVSAVYWFPFYYTFKFLFVLWLALPATSGAQVVFRSFIQPAFAQHFSGPGATAASLRSKIDAALDKTL